VGDKIMDINYKREGFIVEITIRESSGAKLGKFIYNDNDIKKKRRILFAIRNKYGILFKPTVEKFKEKDLEWADKDNSWN